MNNKAVKINDRCNATSAKGEMGETGLGSPGSQDFSEDGDQSIDRDWGRGFAGAGSVGR